MHLRHRWVLIETIGNVYTGRCEKCPRRRTRVKKGQTRR